MEQIWQHEQPERHLIFHFSQALEDGIQSVEDESKPSQTNMPYTKCLAFEHDMLRLRLPCGAHGKHLAWVDGAG